MRSVDQSDVSLWSNDKSESSMRSIDQSEASILSVDQSEASIESVDQSESTDLLDDADAELLVAGLVGELLEPDCGAHAGGAAANDGDIIKLVLDRAADHSHRIGEIGFAGIAQSNRVFYFVR